MTDQKVPIAPTLNALEVGEIATFPFIQYDGVTQGIQRLRIKYKAEGRKWTVDTSGDSIKVTRTD